MRKIENWSIVAGNYQTVRSPEEIGTSLLGKIFNHEKKEQYHRFIDGEISLTSEVIGIKSPDIIKVLSGSLYLLGNPSVEYENMFPNAKHRLMERLRNR